LLAHPAPACAGDVCTLLLRRVQSFFLKLMLRRAKNRHTALRLPAIRRLRIAAMISSSVRSGWSAIRPSRNSACCSSGEVLPPLGFAATLPVSSKRCTQITTTLGLIP
jgi:hypothetical protein